MKEKIVIGGFAVAVLAFLFPPVQRIRGPRTWTEWAPIWDLGYASIDVPLLLTEFFIISVAAFALFYALRNKPSFGVGLARKLLLPESNGKTLEGIGGWLTVYLSGMVISVFGIGGQAFTQQRISIVALVLLVASAIGWGIMITNRAWVKTYHIVFLAGIGVYSLLVGIYEAIPAAAIWIAYWVRSKRVASTYFRK